MVHDSYRPAVLLSDSYYKTLDLESAISVLEVVAQLSICHGPIIYMQPSSELGNAPGHEDKDNWPATERSPITVRMRQDRPAHNHAPCGYLMRAS